MKGGKAFPDFLGYIKSGGSVINKKTGLKKWTAAQRDIENPSGTNTVYNVVFIGDSITEGIASTHEMTKSHYVLTRNAINAKYGDAGVGTVPIYWASATGIDDFFTNVGWTEQTFGYGGRCYYSNANGRTLTGTFTGTGFDLYFYGQNNGAGGN